MNLKIVIFMIISVTSFFILTEIVSAMPGIQTSDLVSPMTLRFDSRSSDSVYTPFVGFIQYAWARWIGLRRITRIRYNPLRKLWKRFRSQITRWQRQLKKNDASDDDPMSVDAGWSKAEFSAIQLGDARLNKRLLHLAETLGARPAAPINQACGDWKAAKAAYRFFDNPKAEWSKILKPHQIQTVQRMGAYPVVLAVQDTTILNYSSHPETAGLGIISTKAQKQRGLAMHSSLALTTNGMNLGLLTLDIWARKNQPSTLTKAERQKLPIEEKESFKWIKALRLTAALTPDRVTVVTVADRESDIYDFMVEARNLKTSYLIRAAHNRQLQANETTIDALWPYMEKQPVLGELLIHIPQTGQRPARTATVDVRSTAVTVKAPPSFQKDTPETLDVSAVWLREINPPTGKGVEPVEWMLLTNVKVDSYQDALERINWYAQRWQIEVFHKILKSGCTVEKCRLETAERLICYITLMAIIAWRIHWMTHVSRQQPNTPATFVLADHEWKALYCRIHRTNVLPDNVPTTYEAVRWIAQLGGFLARKNDKEPGVTTIWRGWQRLNDIADMWLIFNTQDSYG